jgi:hypothetical protein
MADADTSGMAPAAVQRPQGITMTLLPEYMPPNDQRACLAVGMAPLFVLLTFTLIVTRLIEPDTGFAVFAACTVWVMHEMHVYQRTLDDYNADYVVRHLQWRSAETLESLACAEAVPEPTRNFVRRFLGDGRTLRRDGPRL